MYEPFKSYQCGLRPLQFHLLLQVLNLEWSSGAETLRCTGRVDLTLAGSFVDMILLPSVGAGGSRSADLLLLTNPGQLHFYDDSYLSTLMSQHERKPSVSALEFPTVIPLRNPLLTSARLYKLPECSSKDLSKVAFLHVSTLANLIVLLNVLRYYCLSSLYLCR